jgi:hypothetical protein
MRWKYPSSPFAWWGNRCFVAASRIKPARQNKRFAEESASHFVQIADVNERDVAIEAKRSQDRHLRVLAIESVDLVERRLDGKPCR